MRHDAPGWEWDNHLLAYTASHPGKFTCECGQRHAAVGYSNCKCGKIWNGYVIGTGGSRHEASAEKYLMREIPVRPDVIVASRKENVFDPREFRARWMKRAFTLSIPQSGYDWQDEAAGSEPWPSEHHPAEGDRTMSETDPLWHHRDKGKFTKGIKPGPGAFQKKDV